MARWLVVLGGLSVAFAVKAAEAVTGPADVTTWVELLRSGGAATTAVGAIWFALQKDKQVTALTEKHAGELQRVNDAVMDLVSASTAAQVEMRGAVAALSTALQSLERSLDRRGP